MRRFFAFWFIFFVFSSTTARAVVDPLSVPNNRVGVHVFDPTEIIEASKLVNSSGGDWGYITVPIRSNDRDTTKWVEFMTQAAKLHLIPILRISTYPDRSDWTAPSANDLVDFANFLDELPWPTKNRYVILFNEPNHSQEWGGYLSPLEYANLLAQSIQIFKTRSQDFFLISAGLDMSSPQTKTSLDALYYLNQLNIYRPQWFNQVDGLAFHAYPNPAFSASALSKTRYGPKSYTYELDLLYKQGLPKNKPIFITETGTILANTDFYKTAFTQVWTESNIVAITPFVLFAGSSDFEKFSLLDKNHQPKKTYNQIKDLPKTAGSPLLSVIEPTPRTTVDLKPDGVFIREPIRTNKFLEALKKFFDLIKGTKTLTVGPARFEVEVRNTPKGRSQGLSGHSPLSQNQGMLFVFDSASRYSFWMKDMKFALDFVWIRDHKVVDLTENVPPPTRENLLPVVVTPKVPVDQVLEISAGGISSFGISLGDSAFLN